MARLAFVAVMLLASAPTISRWAVSDPSPAAPERVGICTASGLEYVAVSATAMPGAAVAGEESPAPHRSPSGMDPDCTYCPLLATTTLPPLARALRPAPVLANLVPTLRLAPHKASARYPGHGSRGPPLAL